MIVGKTVLMVIDLANLEKVFWDKKWKWNIIEIFDKFDKFGWSHFELVKKIKVLESYPKDNRYVFTKTFLAKNMEIGMES